MMCGLQFIQQYTQREVDEWKLQCETSVIQCNKLGKSVIKASFSLDEKAEY